jgi:hypothetical protein
MIFPKGDVLQQTGATSADFDRAFRRTFGSEYQPDSVPDIWLPKLLQLLVNRPR